MLRARRNIVYDLSNIGDLRTGDKIRPVLPVKRFDISVFSLPIDIEAMKLLIKERGKLQCR